MSPAASTHSSQHVEKTPQASPAAGEYDDAEKNFQPKTLKFWMIIIGMYMSIFLVALDRMIIATAIPKITDEFHSIADISWYGSAYMLTGAIFVPLSGRIYQLYSTKWVFLVSIIIFEAGSALCATAPSSTAFIVGRAVAGIGSAGIFSGGTMILLPLVPLRRRPMFVSFFGVAFGICSVLGPIVGGAFSDNANLTWRWCFYINLPIGAFTFVAVLFLFNFEAVQCKKLTIFEQFKSLDPLGLLFFIPSMVCLVLALQWGGSTYPWSAPRVIALLVVFAVTLIAFLVVEVYTPKTAMAPMRVILNRSVGGAMLFMLLLAGGMMAIIYYLAIWFQAAQGQSALEAGIRTIPLVISMTVLGIMVAVIVEKIGYYNPPMLLSPVICAVGAGMLSTLVPNAGSNHWIGYQVIYGMGIGFGFQIATMVPHNILPRADVSIGMAMMFFMQQLGGSIFLAVGQNIFSSKLVDSLSGVAGLDTGAIVNTGATALRSVVPAEDLEEVIGAYSYALTRVFLMSAALSACMVLGAVIQGWKSIKGKKSAPADAESGEEQSEAKEDGAVQR